MTSSPGLHHLPGECKEFGNPVFHVVFAVGIGKKCDLSRVHWQTSPFYGHAKIKSDET